jgi:toxin ParE1/3/4
VKSVRWAKQARRDIERIPDLIPIEIYPDIVTEIVAAARFIASTPKAGPMVGNGSDRKWPVNRYPYLLIYRVKSDQILVSRVVHSRSDWTAIL